MTQKKIEPKKIEPKKTAIQEQTDTIKNNINNQKSIEKTNMLEKYKEAVNLATKNKLQVEAAKQNALKYVNNNLAMRGLNSQGAANSANLGIINNSLEKTQNINALESQSKQNANEQYLAALQQLSQEEQSQIASTKENLNSKYLNAYQEMMANETSDYRLDDIYKKASENLTDSTYKDLLAQQYRQQIQALNDMQNKNYGEEKQKELIKTIFENENLSLDKNPAEVLSNLLAYEKKANELSKNAGLVQAAKTFEQARDGKIPSGTVIKFKGDKKNYYMVDDAGRLIKLDESNPNFETLITKAKLI